MNTTKIQNLHFRTFRGASDYPHIARIETASWIADGLQFTAPLSEIENVWAHFTNCDPYRDALFAEVAGETVAYARVNWAITDTPSEHVGGHNEQHFHHIAFVHPDWRRRGIGTQLQSWMQQRIAQLAVEHPHDGARYMRTFSFGSMHGKTALLERNGFERFRYGFMMRRPFDQPIDDTPVPAGIEIRPMLPEHYAEHFWARNEAFRDHFGHREMTEQDLASELEFLRTDEMPHLWQIAWDVRANKIVGGVRCHYFENENQLFGFKRGWTDPIFVSRAWRGKGLAKALITRGMRRLQQEGMTEAYLGVDGQNPNGALKLYESLGYVVDQQTYQWRKPIADSSQPAAIGYQPSAISQL